MFVTSFDVKNVLCLNSSGFFFRDFYENVNSFVRVSQQLINTLSILHIEYNNKLRVKAS